MKKQYLVPISLSLAALDVGIKQLIKHTLTTRLTIIPHFFHLTYLKNEGAAWGLLSDYPWLLILIAFFFLFFLIREIKTTTPSKRTLFAYAFVLAGLLGNLLDRLLYGYVTDYLQFTFGTYAFPIFNLADILIVIGIFLIILEMIRGEKHDL